MPICRIQWLNLPRQVWQESDLDQRWVFAKKLVRVPGLLRSDSCINLHREAGWQAVVTNCTIRHDGRRLSCFCKCIHGKRLEYPSLATLRPPEAESSGCHTTMFGKKMADRGCLFKMMFAFSIRIRCVWVLPQTTSKYCPRCDRLFSLGPHRMDWRGRCINTVKSYLSRPSRRVHDDLPTPCAFLRCRMRLSLRLWKTFEHPDIRHEKFKRDLSARRERL